MKEINTITKTAAEKAEYYDEKLTRVIENEVPIKYGSGTYELKDGDVFVQAYQKNNPKTHKLPTYWFLSLKEELVISVYHDVPVVLTKQKNGNYYAYEYDLNGKRGRIYAHVLYGLVMGYDCFGTSGKLLDENSIEAIKLLNKEDGVSFHHTHDTTNNSLGEFLPNPLHKGITDLNKKGMPTPDQVEKFLKTEVPNYKKDNSPTMYSYTPKGKLDDGDLAKIEYINIKEQLKRLGFKFSEDVNIDKE